MKIKIHELAVQEFDEAIEWYELQSTGLGKRFEKSVVEQIKKVKKEIGVEDYLNNDRIDFLKDFLKKF